MQEHLIPQDITNYRFHLIGELDLIQFSEILFGIIGGVIIFRTNWPAFIKWPLILIVVSTGLLAAFFPIGDRPLSHWLKIYFAGLFAPTKFYWRKQINIPAFFDFQLSSRHQEFLDQVSTFNAAPVKRHRALVYFDTLASNQAQETDELEIFSDNKLTQITQTLSQDHALPTSQAPAPASSPPQKMMVKKNLKTEQTERVRQIITPSQKTLEQYLSNARIFKPRGETQTISSVENSLKPNLSWPSQNDQIINTHSSNLKTSQSASQEPQTTHPNSQTVSNNTPTKTNKQTPADPTPNNSNPPNPTNEPKKTFDINSHINKSTLPTNRNVQLPTALAQKPPTPSPVNLAAKINANQLTTNNNSPKQENLKVGGIILPTIKSPTNPNPTTISQQPSSPPSTFATTTNTTVYQNSSQSNSAILPGNN